MTDRERESAELERARISKAAVAIADVLDLHSYQDESAILAQVQVERHLRWKATAAVREVETALRVHSRLLGQAG